MKKNNLSEIIMKVSYAMLLFSSYVTTITAIQPLIKYLKIFAVILIISNLIIQSKKYNKKVLIKIILLIILSAVTWYVSKESVVFILYLIVISMKNVELEDFIKFNIITELFIVIFLFIMSSMGLTSEGLFFRDNIRRYSFGFAHPNTTAEIITSILIGFLYLNRENLKIYKILPVFLISILVSKYTDSRTSLFIASAVISCCLLKKSIIDKIIYTKPAKFIIKNIWIICTILTLLAVQQYNIRSEIGIYLNNVLSGRLRLINNFLINYKINLFGNQLVFVYTKKALMYGISAQILDNAFVRYILQFGIIFYAIFYYHIRKVFEYAYEHKDSIFICILFFLIVRGLSEHGCYIIFTNIFLIYIGKVIYRQQNILKENI